MALTAKMKTLEEQHHDYQRHITVLKESLCAKEEHYNMLQADVSSRTYCGPIAVSFMVKVCSQRNESKQLISKHSFSRMGFVS